MCPNGPRSPKIKLPPLVPCLILPKTTKYVPTVCQALRWSPLLTPNLTCNEHFLLLTTTRSNNNNTPLNVRISSIIFYFQLQRQVSLTSITTIFDSFPFKILTLSFSIHRLATSLWRLQSSCLSLLCPWLRLLPTWLCCWSIWSISNGGLSSRGVRGLWRLQRCTCCFNGSYGRSSCVSWR